MLMFPCVIVGRMLSVGPQHPISDMDARRLGPDARSSPEAAQRCAARRRA